MESSRKPTIGKVKRPAVKQVRAWLDSRVRVQLNDGRLIEGHLECFDKPGNIILGETFEVTADSKYVPLGLVLAPHHAVEKILVHRKSVRDETTLRASLQALRVSTDFST